MQAGTSLYVGPGVRIEGKVTQENRDEVIVIAGVLAGDIVTQGRVVVESDGKIEAANELRCFELEVQGVIEGGDVLVEAGVLRLGQSARISVGEISLPLGGLEQSRGSVLCAKLRMEESNAFAKDERLVAAPTPKTVARPAPTSIGSAAASAALLSSIAIQQARPADNKLDEDNNLGEDYGLGLGSVPPFLVSSGAQP